MCGIVGSFQLDTGQAVTGERIGLALQRMLHRGPDDEGRYVQGRTVLGHRRLSVIDTSEAAHQPFTDEDGRHTIVFNGEAFNFQELRAKLEADGHRFRSASDTEVVLRLYTLKGPDFLHDLNGFFALAIHDAEKDTLFLARDRFGVKPLHWAEANGRFLFGSELRALLALGAHKELDVHSVRQFFTYLFIPAPHSPLSGAHKLKPGHSLLVDKNRVKEQRWYDLVSASSKVARPTDPRKELRDLLDDAVRLRLTSDVPVGAFLSGGVDSSIVSALAARHHKDLHTFSIGYSDDPFFDETSYAEEVARHIGSEHSTFKLGREELADGYKRLLKALDEPFADSSALPSFLLCERTRRQVTVALSGDGADEIFGGYRKHQAELRWRDPGAAEKAVALLAPFWRVLPRSRNSRLQDRLRQLDRFARMSSTDAGHRFLQLAAFIPPEEAGSLVSGKVNSRVLKARDAHLMQPFEEMPGMNGVLLADVASTLPNDMLYKVDLTSMAHGLEVRTPFLDRRVVELAFSLSPEEKLRKGSGKHILREAFADLVPASVMSRSKKGFEVPLLALLQGPLQDLVDELLKPDLVTQAGLDKEEVARAVRQMRSSNTGHSQATVHALLVYISWWSSFEQ